MVVEGQSEASTLANEVMPSEYITASNGNLSAISHPLHAESDTLDMFSEPSSLVNELDNILDQRSDGTITPQQEHQ